MRAVTSSFHQESRSLMARLRSLVAFQKYHRLLQNMFREHMGWSAIALVTFPEPRFPKGKAPAAFYSESSSSFASSIQNGGGLMRDSPHTICARIQPWNSKVPDMQCSVKSITHSLRCFLVDDGLFVDALVSPELELSASEPSIGRYGAIWSTHGFPC